MSLPYLQQKILTLPQLQTKLNKWRFLERKIVFTNGCFDLIHKGHIHTLVSAKALGSLLILGLNSDASVKRLKGESRPIQSEADRALILASMVFVDAVVIFEEDTPSQLIQLIQPDVLVKGGDYQKHEVVGAEIVEAKGGEVVLIPYLEGHSTTNILQKG
ncbi:MAG: D-glycero-beta-D-manno-heptose 1-phosphate adenylyltransferase [Chitinophagales bacterium]